MQNFSAYSVLIVEDVFPLAVTYQAIAKRLGCKVSVAENAKDALRLLECQSFACALMDLNLPDMHGFELMAELLDMQPDCAIIVITADDKIETAVQATHAGAVDFLQKPIDPDRLLITLRNTLKAYSLKSQLAELEAEAPSSFAGFVGKSPPMRALYQMIETVAVSRAPVMIHGESGTGKELAAKAIHDLSPRANKPFVAINCAAIAKDLIESELFGHVKGAYTGAHSDRKGAFLEADGGTLFLDEIAEMELAVQAKVLRALQSGEVRRLGDTKTQQVNIRVVCATHRNLLQMVEKQQFREDLFYRLNVIVLDMPPLRERGEDIVLIAQTLLRQLSQEEHKQFEDFDTDAKRLLMQHEWPGNVRELINAIRAIVALNSGLQVTSAMVAQVFRKPRDKHERYEKTVQAQQAMDHSSVHVNFDSMSEVLPASPAIQAYDFVPRTLAQIEREAIEHTLQAVQGNVIKAAQLLDVNASTLYRKLSQWGDSKPSVIKSGAL